MKKQNAVAISPNRYPDRPYLAWASRIFCLFLKFYLTITDTTLIIMCITLRMCLTLIQQLSRA